MYRIKGNKNSKITDKMYIHGIFKNKYQVFISRYVVSVLLPDQKCLQLPLKCDAAINISYANRQTVP